MPDQLQLNQSLITSFSQAAQTASKIGGEQLLNWAGKFKAREKNPGDYVTEADLASQQAIQAFLAEQFPEHHFLGEEATELQTGLQSGRFCWIVDPLDGTRNYINQLNSYSVSVALVYTHDSGEDEIIAAAVYDPVVKECFSAAKGLGACLNQAPIQPGSLKPLSKSMLVCSFPTQVRADSLEVRRFVNLLIRSGSMRRLGSAALNLCYVACGRIDAYWATSVQTWDVAAGALILQEAGGGISDIDGSGFSLREPKLIAFANESLQQEIIPWLQAESIVEIDSST